MVLPRSRSCPMGAAEYLLLSILFFTMYAPYEARDSEVPRYETVYACEGKTLKIDCKPGEQINLIRANYGRFSITICNDHGNTDWSVNCMSPKSLRVLHNKCSQQQNCSILASTSMFGDPCPGTLKYLEAHYQCMPVTSSTTTKRPSPPWLMTSQPSVWSTSTIRTPTARVTLPPTSTVASSSVTTASTSGAPVQLPSSTSPPPVQSTPNNESNVDKEESEVIQDGKTEEVLQTSLPTSTKDLPTLKPLIVISTPVYEYIPSTNETPYLGETDFSHYCNPSSARNLYWNWTRIGEVNVQPCPGGATGLARWRCVQGIPHSTSSETSEAVPFWSPESPDLSECRSVWLNSLESRVNEGDSLISITNDLSQVTSSKTLYGGDMMTTTKIIKKMAQKMAVDIQTFPDQRQREAIVTDLLHGVVRTGSNLLDSAQHPSWRDLSYDDQMRVATSLLIGLEENAFLLADTVIHERTVIQKVKNIYLSVRVVDTRNIGKEEIFPSNSSMEQWTASDDFIKLPREALIENSEGGLVRLVFVAFDRLEEILKPPYETHTIQQIDGEIQASSIKKNTTRVLNSKVISASLGKGRHIQLSQPIKLSLRHLRVENVSNPSCVFWDYTVNIWSEEGCRVESSNRTHTNCLCDHLTNFAILMDIHSTPISAAHQVALQIITYIGCIISVVCLVLAIITFQLFRGLKSDRTTIHKNLCVCLLLAELVFLAGISQTDKPVLCGVVAGLLHFFFLCAFAWMFLEGFQLYVMLIEVFEAEKSRIRWYYLVAYGAPFIIVAVSIAIDPLSYGTSRYCWLRADNFFIFSFVGPVIVVILANLVFLSMAIFMMCRHASASVSIKSKEHSRLASASGEEENALQNKLQFHLAWLRGAIVLVFLLGLTWTFGLLYLNEESIVMAYIFTALNSLQGLFIFVFHCIQNEKVRKEYRKFIRRHSWLPKCLRCSKTGSTSSNGPGSCGGPPTGGKERRSSLYGASNSNPSAPNTDSSALSPHATSQCILQRGWSSRSCSTMTRIEKLSTTPQESLAATPIDPSLSCFQSTQNADDMMSVRVPGSAGENIDNTPHSPHPCLSIQPTNMATLPYVRTSSKSNGAMSNSNLPKSATTTWGPLKPPMWKNISFKSYSRDSGHGSSEQEDSPRIHNTTLVGSHSKDQSLMREGRRHLMSTPAKYHHKPELGAEYFHPDFKVESAQQMRQLSNGAHSHQTGTGRRRGHGTGLRAASPWNHTYTEIREGRELRDAREGRHHLHEPHEDDPVYEEIERNNEILISDMSDEDGRRQSDMSRQSSRSYGDHRPLIPYSPGERGINTDGMRPLGNSGLAGLPGHYDRDRVRDHPRYARQHNYMPGLQDNATRSLAAVLDGDTVVCHLEPPELYLRDSYNSRTMVLPPYSEC